MIKRHSPLSLFSSNRVALTIISAFLLVGLFFGLPSGVSHAAGPVASIELTNLTFIQCNQFPSVFQGRFSVVAKDANGDVVNTPGNPLSFIVTASSGNGGDTFDILVDSDFVQEFAIAAGGGSPITSGSIQVALALDPSIQSAVYVWDCSSQSVIPGGTPGGSPGDPSSRIEDDRLNLSQGELMAILYARPDRNGKLGVHVYGVSHLSTGYLIGIYPNSDFVKYLDNPPAKNTKIRSIGQTTLYALTTGEFQINIGPDANGEIIEVIFSGIPPTNVYYR